MPLYVYPTPAHLPSYTSHVYPLIYASRAGVYHIFISALEKIAGNKAATLAHYQHHYYYYCLWYTLTIRSTKCDTTLVGTARDIRPGYSFRFRIDDDHESTARNALIITARVRARERSRPACFHRKSCHVRARRIYEWSSRVARVYMSIYIYVRAEKDAAAFERKTCYILALSRQRIRFYFIPRVLCSAWNSW